MNSDYAPYGNLPIFPTIYGSVTEDRVERMVERLMDAADAIYLRDGATEAQYRAWTKKLDDYASELLK